MPRASQEDGPLAHTHRHTLARAGAQSLACRGRRAKNAPQYCMVLVAFVRLRTLTHALADLGHWPQHLP
jgi:hypothetical protein